MIDQELGCSIVEPGIKLVDDGFVADSAEDSDNGRDWTNQEKDG